MLELPETLNIAKQLRDAVAGGRVVRVLPPTKLHKFCFFTGEPEGYNDALAGRAISSAEGFGIFAELAFEGGKRLCFNDGINLRLADAAKLPDNFQLALCLEDGRALVFTVAMYGGIALHEGDYDNEYYLKSRAALSPLSPEFPEYYRRTVEACKPSLSAKALLATQQRFPGIGNGVVQDILFNARLHPKRKLSTLDAAQLDLTLDSIRSTLAEMIKKGGRDTEKDLHGKAGGYKTKMSKNALAAGCPVCGGAVTKEAYLGGSVYYCAHCQPL